MILSENRYPLFGIRYPLFGIGLWWPVERAAFAAILMGPLQKVVRIQDMRHQV
jgi:hypothetical protein